jgi:hypothetical protein
LTDEEERRAITAAMQRLFAGTPLHSSSKLDILALAQEAGLKRNKLTHKHTDLKELFYAQRKARDGTPDNEVKLRGQIATLQTLNQTLRDERDRYRITSETFARALNVLTIENDNFRRELAKPAEPGVAGEGRPAEPGVADEGRPAEPGAAGEGRPDELGVACEGHAVEINAVLEPAEGQTNWPQPTPAESTKTTRYNSPTKINFHSGANFPSLTLHGLDHTLPG